MQDLFHCQKGADSVAPFYFAGSASRDFLAGVEPSEDWGFASLTRKETGYITHGYHRYPAKFIPQLARKLISDHSQEGDLVVDPFGGCGTTAIEARVNHRRALAVDVNPVAVMISKAKINAIAPGVLRKTIATFWQRHDAAADKGEKLCALTNARIDHWFRPSEKRALARILAAINQWRKGNTRNFLTCAFSNILKNCSMWSMKSNKPLHDGKKMPAEPVAQFRRQLCAMTRMNAEYYGLLLGRKAGGIKCDAVLGNAENVEAEKGEVDLVVTSPPYVTSYEYADLHQLPALWLGLVDDLPSFRKDFIGSSYARRAGDILNSATAAKIVDELSEKSHSLSVKAAIYFTDMNRVFGEMRRILRGNGRLCAVIGDTELRGVKIRNTQVFAEQMSNLGFEILDVVARRIISKCIPATRDAKTGKFSSVKASDKLAYPVEYIVVARRI